MRRRFRQPCLALALILSSALGLTWVIIAGPVNPRIDLIEPFLTNQVMIHFDTEANLTYELQYTEKMTNGLPTGPWTNLFTAPNIPSVNHYVIVDTRKRPQRFYRLRIYP